MKRINYKFLLLVIIPVILLFFGGHYLRGFNVDRTTDILLIKAKEAKAAGETNDAIKYYNAYLKNRNDDVATQAEYAMLLSDALMTDDGKLLEDITPGDARRYANTAEPQLETALRKAIDQPSLVMAPPGEPSIVTQIRRRLAQLQWHKRSFSEPREHIRKYLEEVGNDTEMELLDAKCAMQLREFDDALKRVSMVVGYDEGASAIIKGRGRAPHYIDAYFLLGRILMEQKVGRQVVDGVFEQMIASNPKSAEAFLIRARHLRRPVDDVASEKKEQINADRRRRSTEDFAKAMELSEGNNPEILIENVVLAIQDEQFELAEAITRDALKQFDEDARFYIQLARLQMVKGDMEAAVKAFDEGLEKMPENRQLIWLRFTTQLDTSNVEAARASVQQMVDLVFLQELIDYAKARILMVEEKWPEAVAEMNRIRPQLQLHRNREILRQCDLARSICYRGMDQPDKENEALDSAMDVAPDSGAVVLANAYMEVRRGRFDESANLIGRAMTMMGTAKFFADERLARKLYAIRMAQVARNPENKDAHEEVQTLLAIFRKQDWFKPSHESRFLAQYQIARGDIEEAKKRLKEAQQANPDDPAPSLATLGFVDKQHGVDKALEKLELIERKFGLNLDSTVLKVRFLLKKNGEDVREELVALESRAEKLDENEQFVFWKGLGSAYYRLIPQDREEVRRCWRKALQLRPTDARLLEFLFDLAREGLDEVAMVEATNDIKNALGADTALYKYALASRETILVRMGRRDPASALPHARTLVEEGQEIRPNWHVLTLLEGEINELEGRKKDAIESYKASLELKPANPVATKRLVQMLLDEGKVQETREYLDMLTEPQLDEKMKRIVIIEAIAADEPARAIKFLAQAVPDDSQNANDHLWKATLLMRLEGQEAQAESSLRRALELRPRSQLSWRMLIGHLADQGRIDEAESLLRAAENVLPEDAISSLMAEGYTKLDQPQIAEKYHLESVAMHPDNLAVWKDAASFYIDTNQRKKAETFLQKIPNWPDSGSSKKDELIQWARRNLAKLYGKTGQFPFVMQAMNLLESNVRDGSLDIQDARVLVDILSSRNEPAFKKQTLQMLNQLSEHQPLSDRERMTQAKLLDQSGKSIEARVIYVGLARNNKDDIDFVLAAARHMIENDDVGEAERWVNRGHVIAPDNIKVIQTRVEWLKKRGRSAEAARVVREWVPEEINADNEDMLRQAGEILSGLGKSDESEKLLKQYVERRPERRDLLGLMYAKTGQQDRALSLGDELLKENAKKWVPPVLSLASEIIRQTEMKLTPEQRQRIRDWCDQAESLFPNATVMLSTKALLHKAAEETEKSELLYREALGRSGISAVQRGILANNLAFSLVMQNKSLDEARQFIDLSTSILGPQSELLDTSALIYMASKDYEKAVKELTTATLFGADAEIYFHLALAHQMNNDKKGAEAAITEAEQRDLYGPDLNAWHRERYESLRSWLRR